MGDTSGLTIGLDLPSYGELAKMLHNAERRERRLKKRIRDTREMLNEFSRQSRTYAMIPIRSKVNGKRHTLEDRIRLNGRAEGLSMAAAQLHKLTGRR